MVPVTCEVVVVVVVLVVVVVVCVCVCVCARVGEWVHSDHTWRLAACLQ
jgi:hypothetical protein